MLIFDSVNPVKGYFTLFVRKTIFSIQYFLEGFFRHHLDSEMINKGFAYHIASGWGMP